MTKKGKKSLKKSEMKSKNHHVKRINSKSSMILLIAEIIFPVFTAAFIVVEAVSLRLLGMNCKPILKNNFAAEFFKDGSSHIMDGFCLLWGMSITIVLFLIESGNTYWYGMRLKRIIRAMLNKTFLFVGTVEYILLCPITYITEVKGFYNTCLWCNIWTFALFIVVPPYIIYITRKDAINHLILNDSTNDLLRMTEERKDKYTEMKLQQLLISSMIVNTVYEDSQEVEQLVVIMQGMFRDKKIDKVISNTFINRVTVMTWVDQIVERSGFGTERERERTTYILKRLWEIIEEEVQSAERDREKQGYKLLSYAVEILLPLFYRKTEDTNRIFISVWANMTEVRYKVCLYLFLYAEFCHRDCQQEFLKKYYDIISGINISRDRLKTECHLWEKYGEAKERQLAWEFWIAWTSYRDGSNNIGLGDFNEFCNDVEKISRDNIFAVRTYTMKKVRNILK